MGDRGNNRHGRKEGVAVPLSRTDGTTSNTMWPVSTSTSVKVASSSIQPFGHIDMGQKMGGSGCALFSGGSWVPIECKVAWAEVYLHTKWHLSPSSRLATTDNGRKFGGCAPLGEGSWVFI